MSLSDPSTWGHLPTFLRGVRSQASGDIRMHVEAQGGRACPRQGLLVGDRSGFWPSGTGVSVPTSVTPPRDTQDTQATWRPASPAADPPSLRPAPMGSPCFLTACVVGKIMTPKGHVLKS